VEVNKKIEKFLNENKIKYELIEHRKVFTAYDKAATLKVKPKVVAKTLVLRLDKDFAIVLIPANKNLDKEKIKKQVNIIRKKNGLNKIKKVDFVNEAWMKKNLKGTKIGAIPPFGGLWKIQTFADKSFLNEKTIFINAGDYCQSLKVSPKIFQKLSECVLGSFSVAK